MRKKELSHRKPSQTRTLDPWAQGMLPLSCLAQSLRGCRVVGVRSLSLIQEDTYAEEVH